MINFFIYTVLAVSLFSANSFATDNRSLVIEGTLIKNDGNPVTTNTSFTIQVTDTAGTCVLWEETLSQTPVNGGIALQLGTGTVVYNGGGGSIDLIFKQGSSISCKSGVPTANITPAANDDRNVAISFNDGTGPQSLTSQIPVKTVPWAMFAENVNKIGGQPISATVPSANQYLQFNGGQWTPTTLPTYLTVETDPLVPAWAKISSLSANFTTGANVDLSNIGTAGTYAKVTTDAKGRVTAGSSLAATDIATAVAPGTSGNVLTSNGSTWISSAPTGGMTNPMTTLGDVIYGAAAGAPARLAGNTTTSKQFLTQTGTGAISAAPTWGSLIATDIPNLDISKITSGMTANSLLMANGTGTAVTSTLCPNGQILKSSAGGTTWSCAADLSGTPSGTIGQIQFHDTGSTFGGASQLYWDSANNSLGLGTVTPGSRFVINDTSPRLNGSFRNVASISGDIVTNVTPTGVFMASAKPTIAGATQFAAMYGTVDYSNNTNTGSSGSVFVGEIKLASGLTTVPNDTSIIQASVEHDSPSLLSNAAPVNASVKSASSRQINNATIYKASTDATGDIYYAAGFNASISAKSTNASTPYAYGFSSNNVSSNSSSTTPTYAYGLYINNVNASSASGTSNAYGLYIGNISATGGSTNNKYAIYSGDGSLPSYHAGKFGIGTPNPMATLDVGGTIRIAYDASPCTPSISGSIRYNSPNMEKCDGSSWTVMGGGSSQWQNSAANIYFNTGYVAIGHSAPSGALDVEGSTFFRNSIGTASVIAMGSGGAEFTLRNFVTPTVADILLGNLNFSSDGINPAVIGGYSSEPHTGAGKGSHLRFYTTPNGSGSATEKMRIMDNGNVGIATVNPTAKLEVNGNLKAGALQVGSSGMAPVGNMGICSGAAAGFTTSINNISNGLTYNMTCTGAPVGASVSCSPDTTPVITKCIWTSQIVTPGQVRITLHNRDTTSASCFSASVNFKCLVADY